MVRNTNNNMLQAIPNYSSHSIMDVFDLKTEGEFSKTNGNKLSVVSYRKYPNIKRFIKSFPKDTSAMQKKAQSPTASFVKEVDMLLHAKHENIVKMIYYGSFLDYNSIMLEYCEMGTLCAHFKNMTRSKANRYLEQIGLAVKHLHDQHIVHRDIKSSNILVTANDVIKLIDFELSTALSPGQTMVSGRRGTYGYMAPEMKSSSTYDGYKTDMYAMGAVFWCLQFKRHLPRDDRFPFEQVLAMVAGNEDLTSAEREILNGLLAVDPAKRWDINRLMNVIGQSASLTDKTEDTTVVS